MKKFLLALMAFFGMMLGFTSCGDDKKDDNSGSSELQGTLWERTNENDNTYYGATVIYTVTFGKGNEMCFNRNINGDDNLTKGTYTYKNGSGVMYATTVVPVAVQDPDTGDYEYQDQEMEVRCKFTIDGTKMTFNFSLKDIILDKVLEE